MKTSRKISRRQLLELGLMQAGASILPRKATAAHYRDAKITRRTEPSILQGATDESRTQFSIVHRAQEKFAVSVHSPRGQSWS
ncbi:MAG: hypothetical protein C5B49_15960, partial [Bdellovibrio sp.]